MKYKFRSEARWSNGEDWNHQVSLDLDLMVSDILQSDKDIELRLKLNETKLREEMFKLVAEKIVPKIIQDTGVDYRQPEGHLQIQANTSIHSKAVVGIPTRKDTSLYIRDRMQLVFNLATSRPVNAAQALYANRGGVASDITNELMKLLKRSVLGVEDRSTNSNWSLSGDQVQSFNHSIKESSADEN